MTPEEKLRKAIELLEEEDMEIESKPITYEYLAKHHAVVKLPIQPFELWIEDRQKVLWENIRVSNHYPEDLINEWAFLDEMRKEWAYRNE